jgi:hypothetical protein
MLHLYVYNNSRIMNLLKIVPSCFITRYCIHDITVQVNVSVQCFVDRCFSFFLSAIVLSVLFRFTDSDYPFRIFKVLLNNSTYLNVLYDYTIHYHYPFSSYKYLCQ